MKLALLLNLLIFSTNAFSCYRFKDSVVNGKKTSEIETISNWELNVTKIIEESLSENFENTLRELSQDSNKSFVTLKSEAAETIYSKLLFACIKVPGLYAENGKKDLLMEAFKTSITTRYVDVASIFLTKEELSRNKLLTFFKNGKENIFFVESKEEGTSKVFITVFSASEMINLEVLLKKLRL